MAVLHQPYVAPGIYTATVSKEVNVLVHKHPQNVPFPLGLNVERSKVNFKSGFHCMEQWEPHYTMKLLLCIIQKKQIWTKCASCIIRIVSLNYINVFFEAKGCDVSTWFRKRQCIYFCADVYHYCWEKVVVKSSQGLTLREGPLCVKCKMRLKKNAPPTSMRPLKHRGEGDNCFVKHYMKLDFYCFSQGHW